jgi:nicotinate-nucleotide pyrophosphorylase (carboxylating)
MMPREMATATSLIEAALSEDVGDGDRTSEWTVPAESRSEAVIVAKQRLTVAGLTVAAEVFRAVDAGLSVGFRSGDSDDVEQGDVVMAIAGPTRSLLTAERTALNFLGRLSGIATLTRAFVARVEGTGARIVDTRKTTPGWRALEKMAVRAGGGSNHRMGLDDMVLVKDNHIAAAGGLTAAIERIRRNNDGLPVEVEVRTEDELDEALEAGVKRILLDNMDPDRLRAAVSLVRERAGESVTLEASGNVTLETVRDVAETGVDLISVGALTHSAAAADFSLQVIS